jgi:serine/threonine protein kinase
MSKQFQCYTRQRPELPLKGIQSLQWKKVQNCSGSSLRLLLVDEDTGNAYDADFGFSFNSTELKSIEFEDEEYLIPTTCSTPLLAIRRKENTPYIESEIDFQWFHCTGIADYEIGIQLDESEVARVYMAHAKCLDSLPSPGTKKEDFQIYKKKIIAIKLFSGQFIFLYPGSSFIKKNQLCSLLTESYYGNVYQGIEYSPAEGLHEDSYYEATTPQRQVIVKTYAFDRNIHRVNHRRKMDGKTEKFSPKSLQDLHNQTFNSDKYNNLHVINEVEVMSFLSHTPKGVYPAVSSSSSSSSLSSSSGTTDLDCDSEVFISGFFEEKQEDANEGINSRDINRNQNRQFFPEIISYQVDHNNLYVISDYCLGGHIPFGFFSSGCEEGLTLKQGLLIEQKLKIVFHKILQGIQVLHSAGICHLDISVENICLKNRTANNAQSYSEADLDNLIPVLIDFGFAVGLESAEGEDDNDGKSRFKNMPPRKRSQLNYGKYFYFAPELPIHATLLNPFCQTETESYNPMKVDIWQLGILLFIFLTKRQPFVAKPMELFRENYLEWIRFVDNKSYGETMQKTGGIENYPISFFETTTTTTTNNNNNMNKDGKIKKNKSFFQLKEVFSAECVQLLKKMLTVNPKDRPDIETLLNDPWFQK